jgi:hypothetical protein
MEFREHPEAIISAAQLGFCNGDFPSQIDRPWMSASAIMRQLRMIVSGEYDIA